MSGFVSLLRLSFVNIRGGPNFGPVKYVKEVREAYAFRLNFGPPQFFFEINDHVTQTLYSL